MVQRFFQQAVRFFGAVAASLAGITAVCTSAGFLIERTRWTMMGFGPPPVDVNEYLFAGARFLVLAPWTMLATIPIAALEPRTFQWVLALTVLAGGVALLRPWLHGPLTALVTRVRRPTRWGEPRSDAVGSAEPTRARYRARMLALLLLGAVQFVAAARLAEAGALRNVLFATPASLTAAGCEQAGLGLQSLIALACETELLAHMGRAYLIVGASFAALWLLMPAEVWRGRTPLAPGPAPGGAAVTESAPGPANTRNGLGAGGTAIAGINLILLAIQAMLLPINFAAVFPHNEFPVVEVALTEEAVRPEAWPAEGRFALIGRRGDELVLYAASAGRAWLIPRNQVGLLVHFGLCDIFELDGRCRPELPSSLQEPPP